LRRGLEWKTSEPLEGNERFDTGVALGKIHAPRMHILPKMRRRLHNKSHQTKNTLVREIEKYPHYLDKLEKCTQSQNRLLEGDS